MTPAEQIRALDPHPTAVSPWLELTRWPEYLWGQDLAAMIQINTFFHKPSMWNRPIQIHLRPATYHQYCQLAALDQMEEHAQQLLDLQDQDQPVLQGKVQKQLDQACLALLIALLDHPLKGDLFDSTLVGFLVVLGVDPTHQTFQDPYGYTSYLSGLVKMAQMLVALQAVHLAKTS
ncbi:hypothetical protein CNMCM7691_006403 [Aspergillus felis]|uniref:Uncharacterized protein n=1 Tax=Aspergillus felis TaxID=1287682 RepID=A0A8H6VB71_9EURO|nr:hypothetical protein CNMCM7691_006403 [Aspergillus felis]